MFNNVQQIFRYVYYKPHTTKLMQLFVAKINYTVSNLTTSVLNIFRMCFLRKKVISVLLTLILILGVVFSAPTGLFLYSAKAQSINNLPRLSLPPIAMAGKTLPIPIQGTSNGIIAPGNNSSIQPNFNVQAPIRPGGSATTTPLLSSRVSPLLNPNQQQLQQQPRVGRIAPVPNAGMGQTCQKVLRLS